MRKRFDAQIGLGQTPIEKVSIPTKSRDELPPVLAGLQWIFATPEINEEVFTLLEERVVGKKKGTGRPGMDLWHILVLGVVRMALDCDYDRLEHTARYDRLVRSIMGLEDFGGEEQFHHKTISDNVCHVDADLLEKINEIVVRHGHEVLKKNDAEKLEIKTDSYVLECNVHHPTDCNLLWDAARKCVELLDSLHEGLGLGGWRKAKYWKRQVKNSMRSCEKLASSGGANKAQRVKESAMGYVELARRLEEKVRCDIGGLKSRALSLTQLASLTRLDFFHEMLVKHIDLVERRLVGKETIPHEEKVFSIFEPHTELIKKGKVRPPVEFGHRVLLSSAQHGLIIDYKVMEGGSEPGEIPPLLDRLEKRFGKGSIASLSTDKGFSSEENRRLAEELSDVAVMPKKGRRNAAECEREATRRWKKLKNRHSTIESDINCLEHHGLNRCPDKGLSGYKRYVGLGVLAFNLHRIGLALLSGSVAGKRRRKKKAA
jgi:hypothetical protein